MNKLTVEIAKLYIGCQVTYPNTDGRMIKARLTGVSIADNHIETTYKRKVNNCKGDYLSFVPNGNHNSDALHTKLLLRPLSAITDEDAIEVANLLSADKVRWHKVERQPGLIEITDSVRENSVELFLEERIIKIEYEDGKFYTNGWSIEMYDYLRGKHYDCGAFNIPSLIEAGLALPL